MDKTISVIPDKVIPRLPKIKDLIKDKTVQFQYYRDGELWYKTETGFMFPVPASDTGGASFKNTDKAIFFMRWIRKHLEELAAEARQYEIDMNGSVKE